MKSYKVRWTCRDEDCDDVIISVVSYDRVSADRRAEVLRGQGVEGVEVFRVKPGTDEEIPDV